MQQILVGYLHSKDADSSKQAITLKTIKATEFDPDVCVLARVLQPEPFPASVLVAQRFPGWPEQDRGK